MSGSCVAALMNEGPAFEFTTRGTAATLGGMSSLVAWVGVDSRGPASFYLASDSRITWGSPGPAWDTGRKLFAAPTSSDVFGYCGEVLFPALFLSQLDSLATRRVLVVDAEDPAKRHETVRRIAEGSFEAYPTSIRGAFTILHAARESAGMASRFRLWRLDWSQKRGWTDQEIDLPTESVLVLAVGSGADVVTRWDDEWRRRLGRTSRSVFGAFCDALRSKDDPRTGGAPQLVGLYRAGGAHIFGVVSDGKRYVCGLEILDSSAVEPLEWRNELFERLDGRTLELLPGAQRQPRP